LATVAPQLGEAVHLANKVAAFAIGAIAALDVNCAIKLAQQ
jgi:hypothetical protein